MSNEMIETLDQVLANANRLIAGVREDQWDAKTPCTEWNVRDLTNHMAGTTALFGAVATRIESNAGPETDHLGDDPAGAYAAISAATASAWHSEGATDGMVSQPAEMPAVAALGVNILDIGIHCWDLATATDQDHGLTPEMVSTIDHWDHEVVTDDVRVFGFGSPLKPASDDALTTMLAYVGRRA